MKLPDIATLGNVALWIGLALATVFAAWKLYRYMLRLTNAKGSSTSSANDPGFNRRRIVAE